MSDDGRVPLELESITKADSGLGSIGFLSVGGFNGINSCGDDWILKFFYPSKLATELKEDMAPYKDKLYTNMTTYVMNTTESVLTFRTKSIELPDKEAKKLIKDILKTDNEALLNTMHPCETIRQLCSFKIKVCRKKKFSYMDLFDVENMEPIFDD